jgi:hypothetical protein
MIYLLESNVWIGLIRRTSSSLATRYQALAPAADIRVCSVMGWNGIYAARKGERP